jgi:hypothetical protein
MILDWSKGGMSIFEGWGLGWVFRRRPSALACRAARQHRSMSLVPVSNSSLAPRQANKVLRQCTTMSCTFHLGFSLGCFRLAVWIVAGFGVLRSREDTAFGLADVLVLRLGAGLAS